MPYLCSEGLRALHVPIWNPAGLPRSKRECGTSAPSFAPSASFRATANRRGLDSLQGSLTTYVLQRVHAHGPRGAHWSVRAAGPLVWTEIDGVPCLVAHLTLVPDPGVSVHQLLLEDDVITDTLPSHAVLVTVRSDWNSSIFANDPELVGIINGDNRSINIDRAAGHWSKGLGSIFHLGVRHIAEGTDHLLFLFALLLPAPLLVRNRRWASFADIRHGFF